MAEVASGRCCATCALYRPSAADPRSGVCGRVLKGEYWLKGQGPRPLVIRDARGEVCNGHTPTGGRAT